MPGKFVTWLEPADPASPEDMKSGSSCFSVVERRDAEIDRLGLMIDLHQKRRAAIAAEFAVTEARRGNGPHLLRPLDPDEIVDRNARKDHRRRAAVELAGPAMTPAAVERFALELVSNPAAEAATGQSCHLFTVPLIDYG